MESHLCYFAPVRLCVGCSPMHPHELTLDRRRAGVLLHPTSLPGAGENGDLGPEAYRFVDFLAAAGVTVWQMLPIGPTHGDLSPYQCLSVHAGNTRLVSLEMVRRRGWLPGEALGAPEGDPRQYHDACLRAARRHFERCAEEADRADFNRFVQHHAYWLVDYTLYCALRSESGDLPWWQWQAPLRDRDPAALDQARGRLEEGIAQERFNQFLFFRQWAELKGYANERGIQLFGDLPIFVAHDSAEVWAHRDLFALNGDGQPEVVAGVPPDYFSATGQRWGNPLYRWERMAADGFLWWRARVETQVELFDLIRIDHFRGFQAYWEIPAGEETAINGRWVEAPGSALFRTLHKQYHPLPFVAEDLGLITEEVHALRRHFHLPGMKILQFAFGDGPENPYLPHRHENNCVVYTGTHDNNTTVGWYRELPPEQQHRVREYLGFPADLMPWPLIRAAFSSVACLAVVPMQDLLELDGEHRMNTPGTTEGNWRWRLSWEQFSDGLAERIRHLVWFYGREQQGPYRPRR